MLDRLPEALLVLFGAGNLLWFGSQRISILLLVPLGIIVLAGAHVVHPIHPWTSGALLAAYVLGGLLSGFLVFGMLTGPIGGQPAEVEAFNRIAMPLLLLFAVSVVSLLLKLR